MGIGIYVHVPFCVSKCVYCDFYSLPKVDESKKERYVQALLRQIEQSRELYGTLEADTVFFGGGTPTSLKAEQLLRIINTVKSNFNLTRNAELTVEANPATFDSEKLTVLKNAGVNRISLGVQSAQDGELIQLGRIHTFDDAEKAFNLTRSCGFNNVSVDLMYGIPSQSEVSFLDTVSKIIKHSPEHISVYGLQLEEDTPLCKNRHTYTFPNEDECVSMYSKAIALLKENGYYRYEISNFARQGYECAHNLGYWSRGEYLGFGAGAYSYFEGKRFHFKNDVDVYLETNDFSAALCVDEELNSQDKIAEFIMLSLRLTKGFSESELISLTPSADIYLDRMRKFIKSGLMQRENGRIFFTEKGFNVSNSILSEILYG